MKRASVALVLLLSGAAGAASAADLLSVYQDALANDPAIREADANRKAAREARPQAWSALLPQIQGQASIQRGDTDSTRPSIDPTTGAIVNFSQVSNF